MYMISGFIAATICPKRICKNWQKMPSGFGLAASREMYCWILSVIETVKRRKQNTYHSIMEPMVGRPALG